VTTNGEQWGRTAAALNWVSATLALVLLAPILLLIAAAVLAGDGGPIFYRERRLGLHGKPFSVIKFRTLTPASGEDCLVAPVGDPRVTRTGRILRRFHLDELPQLVNILRGEMAFVGPRPAREELWRGVSPELRTRALSFPPGLTSPASLRYLCEDEVLAGYEHPESVYRDVLFPMKVGVDLRYFENRAPAIDLRLMVHTLSAVFLRRDRAHCRQRLMALLQDTEGTTEASAQASIRAAGEPGT